MSLKIMISKVYSKNNNPDELEIVDLVQKICQKYDVPAFTHEVVVEKGAIPHSHPILTLNTRVKDERSILATLTHEQFHWYAQQLPKYNECIAYLKTKYKDDGEHNKSGTYPNSYWEHIVVCFNTFTYLRGLVTDEDLTWIYEQWQPYPTLERLIQKQYDEFKEDLEKFEAILVK